MNEILIIVFILGYVAIASENFIKINKAAIALLTGVRVLDDLYSVFAGQAFSSGSAHTSSRRDIEYFIFSSRCDDDCRIDRCT